MLCPKDFRPSLPPRLQEQRRQEQGQQEEEEKEQQQQEQHQQPQQQQQQPPPPQQPQQQQQPNYDWAFARTASLSAMYISSLAAPPSWSMPGPKYPSCDSKLMGVFHESAGAFFTSTAPPSMTQS
ncbi:unnamed protein product [Polarella glacialis]|uniref:Uncharacterized protein n=1 Tax=Polarella glacialis TaxID=89957 RepID=A0A813GN33_POLGL|nr:unnamed protein product [Polarella glacialis]